MKNLRSFVCALMAVTSMPASADPLVFVTLGTGGGPRVQVERAQPANAVLVGLDAYLFDAGEGTQRQLQAAQIKLSQIRAIFLSHHHIDHVGGLLPLIVGRWVRGIYEPVVIFGPLGTKRMVDGIISAVGPVEAVPVSDGASLPTIASTVRVVELPASEVGTIDVYRNGPLHVSAVTNEHYHFVAGSAAARSARSYSYRIDMNAASVVYSGDTGPSQNLVRLAKDADLLVSEVMDLNAIRRSLEAEGLPQSVFEGVMAHLKASHLIPADVGEIAAAAHVGSVVLTHLVPGVDGDPNTLGYVAGLARTYRGSVIVASDLQRFTVQPTPKEGR